MGCDLLWTAAVCGGLSFPSAYLAGDGLGVEVLCALCDVVTWFTPHPCAHIHALCCAAAHIHHGWRLAEEGYDAKSAMLSTAVQFVYTSLFGIYCGYLFVRTGAYRLLIRYAECSTVVMQWGALL